MKALKIFILSFVLCIFAASPVRSDEGEPDLTPLRQYKPLYFLMGNPYTKIQLSFKIKVVEATPFYFGYSQLMLWNLFISSPYFYDLNYNPLAWYRLTFNDSTQQWVDLIGWEHESNGKGGTLERSWDRVGLAYHQYTRIGERAKLYWDFKAWVPVIYNSNNRNLAQYRGIWELNLTLGDGLGQFFDFNDIAFRLYPGGASLTNPLRGGQELTVRLKNAYRKFLPLFVAQVFHGYGEYLLDYQYEHWGVRAGVGF